MANEIKFQAPIRRKAPGLNHSAVTTRDPWPAIGIQRTPARTNLDFFSIVPSEGEGDRCHLAVTELSPTKLLVNHDDGDHLIESFWLLYKIFSRLDGYDAFVIEPVQHRPLPFTGRGDYLLTNQMCGHKVPFG